MCAPCGAFDTAEFALGTEALEQMGFRTVIPEGIDRTHRYLAGKDRDRAGIVNRLFQRRDIRAIVCARGGYGAMRILDHLDWEMIRSNPKPFVGFSDATALLLSLVQLSQVPVIHGPTVISLGKGDPETRQSFYHLLCTGPPGRIDLEGPVLIRGEAEGSFVGGNLATMNHLTGTLYQPDLNGAILFLEDIAEPAYKVDRMLTQMSLAGLFTGLNGVVIGTLTDCSPVDMIHEVLIERFESLEIPICTGLSAGHDAVNLSLPMGGKVRLNALGQAGFLEYV